MAFSSAFFSVGEAVLQSENKHQRALGGMALMIYKAENLDLVQGMLATR